MENPEITFVTERGADVTSIRPSAKGRFLYLGERKLWVRGVTYGTFRPNARGDEYVPQRVERDFAAIAANGLTAIRTYSAPPRWLLDAAQRHQLHVMVGLPWEQHVAFLDERARTRSIERRLRAGIAACTGHPAVLCYAVGNEIPAPIVRWHGPRAIERFIGRLVDAARDEDGGALVTYVNYPSTEYLELPSVDLLAFNVYLETQDRFQAYLARLHNLAGNRPLILAELGLCSRRNGLLEQARSLEWQVRAAFGSGCAGAFVFAWTDEWYRGTHDVDHWDFGLTGRDRRPKPALRAVRSAMAELPFAKAGSWPRISVVVCTYNGARTIRHCLDGLLRLEYPDVEVIVVDDGSTDDTARIAREYPFHLVSTPNCGLSSARNTGLAAATGEIVAYVDDDAWPDPDWLTYLAATFADGDHGAVGGPNIPPPGDGWIAECVAHAPGGPTHVLLSDREAEHLPGCNLAVRTECLKAVGGFDTQFRIAGDDVDVCWQLRARGWTLGFSPAAMVWHHRRNSVRAYWRQQRGYGRAEALLEKKWPEKYNSAGSMSWAGRLYGTGRAGLFGWRRRIYHGTWGSAPFQSVYDPASGWLATLPGSPEWYLMIALLAGLSALGAVWRPLLLIGVPPVALALFASVVSATVSAVRAPLREPRSWRQRLGSRVLLAWLHLIQPCARLVGRTTFGLTPWRSRAAAQWLSLPWQRQFTVWSERWQAPAARLAAMESSLVAASAVVTRGGDFDAWDLEVRGGVLACARAMVVTEEHGAGRQLWRVKVWRRWSRVAVVVQLVLWALTVAAAVDHAPVAASILGVLAAGVFARGLQESEAASAALVASGRGAKQNDPGGRPSAWRSDLEPAA